MGARPWGICSPTDRIFPGCVWQGVCGTSLLTLWGLCRLSPLSFSALPPPRIFQDKCLPHSLRTTLCPGSLSVSDTTGRSEVGRRIAWVGRASWGIRPIPDSTSLW